MHYPPVLSPAGFLGAAHMVFSGHWEPVVMFLFGFTTVLSDSRLRSFRWSALFNMNGTSED